MGVRYSLSFIYSQAAVHFSLLRKYLSFPVPVPDTGSALTKS